MKASILDLRYRMKDVLQALDRKEEVTVLHRGKVKGKLVPATAKATGQVSAAAHPFFGSETASPESVQETMDKLREGRISGI